MLYLSAIVLAFFLSFLLLTKRNKSQADYILVAWLAVIGFHLLTFYLFFTGQQFEYPTLVGLGLPLPLAHGPFLYLYTRQVTSGNAFSKKQLLHFLPLFLSYLLLGRFYFMPFEQKVEVFRQHGRGFNLQLLGNLYAIYLSGIIYVSLSVARLLSYKKAMVQQFSNTEKINFNWLLYMIIWLVVIWIGVLFVQQDHLIFGAAALFVLWLGYFGIKQVQLFQNQELMPQPESLSVKSQVHKETGTAEVQKTETTASTTRDDTGSIKYQKSTLGDQEASLIHERLRALMAEQKPFTDPDLTLDKLARILKVHPNHLSQVINSKENKSFYDLVNELRIEEFMRRVSLPPYERFTLLSIAYDCGFNSKASFNRNFKKHTGLTPSEYVKTRAAQAS